MLESFSAHPLWLVGATVTLSLCPVILALFTCYLKVSVVLGMIRNAIGAGQIPGATIVMALSIAITLQVMGPVLNETTKLLRAKNVQGFLQAPTAEKLSDFSVVLVPWSEFLKRHSGERELQMVRGLSKQIEVELPDYLPLRVLLPAFLLSELKQAFAMGFALLLPFLAVDLIVANILAGMGMFMVSPAMVALPLKLILFVLSDAWLLISKALVASYSI